jgi:acyl carrier protein
MINQSNLADLEQRLKVILAAVLKVEIQAITPETSQEQFPNWDSLTQLRLIAALEETFSLEFNDEQMFTLTSYQTIRNAIIELHLSQ